MGYEIREKLDDYQDPRPEFLLEYQEEKHIKIQDIQLKEGMPQDTENKNWCKHTEDAQIFLVTPSKGMAYIHGKATRMTVCIDNSVTGALGKKNKSGLARSNQGTHLEDSKRIKKIKIEN
ncbi:hypothetical protein O181_012359 [Austropuccinia psidii MF-1]|uniref:Uncharacterized protein n=1 Tax=Austropuccinia psidii MF-1 TaxID=1389203 RepID=A0A9Q3GMT1_9BASI|nr:hypothetical protein [Austropuccinia psidii MF-1]